MKFCEKPISLPSSDELEELELPKNPIVSKISFTAWPVIVIVFNSVAIA